MPPPIGSTGFSGSHLWSVGEQLNRPPTVRIVEPGDVNVVVRSTVVVGPEPPMSITDRQLFGVLLPVESNPKLIRSRGSTPGTGSFSVGSSTFASAIIGRSPLADAVRSKRRVNS